MTERRPIRVLVVEDSATQRAFLCKALEADGDIVVVGQAGTAVHACAMARQTSPDVITMDLSIPGGGMSAIRTIMESTPRPILLLSGQVPGPRSPEAIEALVAGVVGVLSKPRRWDEHHLQLLRGRIRTLSRVRPDTTSSRPSSPPRRSTRRPVVGIGASTGGPAALTTVLTDLGHLDAPVLCVQHIDARQTDSLASWLARATGRNVCIAVPGTLLETGTVYLGPGGSHLTVSAARRIVLERDPTALHAPSVDRLLYSLAENCGADAIGCVLTGMGRDGVAGLAAIRKAGGLTIAQDEASSVVYGMAAAAVECGAVQRLLPLDAIGTTIGQTIRRG